MEPMGECVFSWWNGCSGYGVATTTSVTTESLEEFSKREYPTAWVLFEEGFSFRKAEKKGVSSEELSYCKDAYNERVASECYIRKTDKRTIKQCAYEDAKSRGKGMVVISRHVSTKGTRRYYVSSWPHFVKSIYPRAKGIAKSFYENIYLEDPCRLYIDIDLDISDVVPEDNTPNSVSVFKRYTEALHAHVLVMVKTLKCLLELIYRGTIVTDVFVIDSSSAVTKKRKFSQHLIFHLDGDGTFFRNSEDLLHLFDHIQKTSHVAEYKGIDQSENPFFWPGDIKLPFLASSDETNRAPRRSLDVKDEEVKPMEIEGIECGAKGVTPTKTLKDRSFIADMLVFGNTSREFRIVGSTKYGENRHLKLVEHVHFENPHYMLEKVDFENTCQNFDTFARLLACFVRENRPISDLVTFEPKNDVALNDQIVGFIKGENDDIRSSSPSSSSSFNSKRQKSFVNETIVSDDFCSIEDMKEQYEKMPAELRRLFDEFSDEKKREYVFEVIASDIMRQNPQLAGETIDWTRYVTRDGSFAVSFRTSSKYCEIKGDEHGSNHVYYVVWLTTKSYYQKCWNLTCCQQVDRKLTSRIPTREGGNDHIAATGTEEEECSGNDETSEDGDTENDQKRKKKAFEMATKIYEDNRNIISCKSGTKILSYDIWEIVQGFLNTQKTTIEQYKRFRRGDFDESMRSEMVSNYEIMEEIDLSEDDELGDHGWSNEKTVPVTYESADRFKIDPILNDLFPHSK